MNVNAEAVGGNGRRGPRVCLCILMNHAYPRNLPLLREIYLGRFSELLFLVPFERLDDRDVITVYRGSYTHAGYITDARRELGEVDCDYFIFCHDDVLLNPQLNERSFPDIFPLGPNDGFISRAGPLPAYIGGWDWYFGMVPKMLQPKSLLFGAGLEYASLVKHLPRYDAVELSLHTAGMGYTKEVRLSSSRLSHVEMLPSCTVINGNNIATDLSNERQASVEALSLEVCKNLADALKISSDLAGREHLTEDGEPAVDLPIPLIASGYFTDLYILPKSRLADYAHYVGVASAANLFVEILAPTLLYTCCDKVWGASELGLNDTGFERRATVEEFGDRRFLAIHPFKMSNLSNPAKRALLTQLRAIAGESDSKLPIAIPGGTNGQLLDFAGPEASGWHAPEDWGSWAAEPSATLRFFCDAVVPLRGLTIQLVAPTHPNFARQGGWLTVNDRQMRVSVEWPETELKFVFSAADLQPGANIMELKSDGMVRPADVDPALANDNRLLGLGIRAMTFF